MQPTPIDAIGLHRFILAHPDLTPREKGLMAETLIRYLKSLASKPGDHAPSAESLYRKLDLKEFGKESAHATF